MKKYLFFLGILGSTQLCAQHHKLNKLWETDTIVAVPESVLPDPADNTLFVSLIDGDGWAADHKGGVAKLSSDGKRYDSTWITGLNAPKGLGIFGNRLYAADISSVVVIDIIKGGILKKIEIPGATGLNDISVSESGIVYVSDSKQSKIWMIENDLPALFLDSVHGANGVKAIGSDLIYAQGPDLMKVNAQKKISKIATVTESIDGIEPIGNGDYLASAWVGYIWYVYADGRTELLLDTHEEKSSTADIGYDPATKTLYVPTFFKKKVLAYSLQSN